MPGQSGSVQTPPLFTEPTHCCLQANCEAQVSCLLAFDQIHSCMCNKVYTRMKGKALLEPP